MIKSTSSKNKNVKILVLNDLIKVIMYLSIHLHSCKSVNKLTYLLTYLLIFSIIGLFR